MSRGIAALLALTVVLSALVLLQRPWEARVVEQQVGGTWCEYDAAERAVVTTVPMRIATRGEVTWDVQAQVRDRRDPSRQPFVTTRSVSFDTGGDLEKRELQLSIPMAEKDWLAGFDRCGVLIRSVDLG
jgi:hypothetical protein